MASEGGTIRVVKRKKNHVGHHGGAWKVAYADFVTAMMAFFLVMWIVGMSQNVKDAVAGYFKDPAGFMKAVRGGNAPFSTGMKSEAPKSPQELAKERAGLARAKESIEQMMSSTPQFKEIKNYVDVTISDEGLKIDLLEAKESLFFDSGSAKVKPSTRSLLAKVAAELGKLPNQIILEGHTDSRPLARTDGYTNWELSSDRANSARQVMVACGLRKDQVAQVRGYADTQPRDPANPAHFSNRRVSIIMLMSDAMRKQVIQGSDSSGTSTGKASRSNAGAHPADTSFGVDVKPHAHP